MKPRPRRCLVSASHSAGAYPTPNRSASASVKPRSSRKARAGSAAPAACRRSAKNSAAALCASISRRRDDGTLEQLDRGGNPTINPVLTPDGQKNLFNSRQPADDVANYLGSLSAILANAGGYSPEAARAAALQVLPDILHYDRTKPATYPNGRVLTDDVASLRYAWLTNGKVPPSGLKPHDDLLARFPYLGPPNP